MDVADEAQRRIENFREGAVARVVAASAHVGRPDCETCGEDIEAARRAAYPAACKCISCQEAAERSRAQYRVGA